MNATKQADSQPAAQQHQATSAATASTRAFAQAQRLGNRHLDRLLRARLLQAKLTVSNPHDVYEQEADRVAEQVMRMAEPAAQVAAHCAPLVQRRCSGCEEELQRSALETKSVADRGAIQRQILDDKTDLQRSEESAGGVPTVDAATENSIGSLSSRGSALPQSMRSFMEPRFNADFSAVRVHTDAHAHELARSVNAQAFTVGSNVVFGAGHYAPETDSGKRLLAHELTHVVQQRGSGSTAPVIARRPGTGAAFSVDEPRGPLPAALLDEWDQIDARHGQLVDQWMENEQIAAASRQNLQLQLQMAGLQDRIDHLGENLDDRSIIDAALAKNNRERVLRQQAKAAAAKARAKARSARLRANSARLAAQMKLGQEQFARYLDDLDQIVVQDQYAQGNLVRVSDNIEVDGLKAETVSGIYDPQSLYGHRIGNRDLDLAVSRYQEYVKQHSSAEPPMVGLEVIGIESYSSSAEKARRAGVAYAPKFEEFTRSYVKKHDTAEGAEKAFLSDRARISKEVDHNDYRMGNAAATANFIVTTLPGLALNPVGTVTSMAVEYGVSEGLTALNVDPTIARAVGSFAGMIPGGAIRGGGVRLADDLNRTGFVRGLATASVTSVAVDGLQAVGADPTVAGLLGGVVGGVAGAKSVRDLSRLSGSVAGLLADQRAARALAYEARLAATLADNPSTVLDVAPAPLLEGAPSRGFSLAPFTDPIFAPPNRFGRAFTGDWEPRSVLVADMSDGSGGSYGAGRGTGVASRGLPDEALPVGTAMDAPETAMLDKVVADARKAVANDLPERIDRWENGMYVGTEPRPPAGLDHLSPQCMQGKCGIGRSAVASELQNAGVHPRNIFFIQMGDVAVDAQHGMNVYVSPTGKLVALDTTYAQFTGQRTPLTQGAEKVMMSTARGRQIREDLLTKGYFLLDDESASIYARAVSGGQMTRAVGVKDYLRAAANLGRNPDVVNGSSLPGKAAGEFSVAPTARTPPVKSGPTVQFEQSRPGPSDRTMAGALPPSRPPTGGGTHTPGPAAPAHERLMERLAEGIDHSLAPRPGHVANPPPAGEYRRGLYEGDAAYTAYNEGVAVSGGREVGLFYNSHTGEYRVMIGHETGVGAPDLTGWDAVLHYHPSADTRLAFRLPAPQDYASLMSRRVASDAAVREFIEFDIPGVGRGRTEYGIDPAHPGAEFYVRIHRSGRAPETLRFAGPKEFAAHWGERTVYVEPGSQLYEEMLHNMRFHNQQDIRNRKPRQRR